MASNPNKTFADQIVEAHNTGKEAVITYDGTDYSISTAGLISLIVAVIGDNATTPTTDLTLTGTLEADTVVGDSTVMTTDLNTVGSVFLNNLPTADPAVQGQIWANSGVLTVSAG